MQFIGRKDRTHCRLYRALPYACDIDASEGASSRTLAGHDRGLVEGVRMPDGRELAVTLSRHHFPPADGPGLVDELHLILADAESGKVVELARAEPRAARIVLVSSVLEVACRRGRDFPPMPVRE